MSNKKKITEDFIKSDRVKTSRLMIKNQINVFAKVGYFKTSLLHFYVSN